jgi:hypothetical protein
MFTYDQLAITGMLDAGNEEFDISLVHDGTILSSDGSASVALVSCHDDEFAMKW